MLPKTTPWRVKEKYSIVDSKGRNICLVAETLCKASKATMARERRHAKLIVNAVNAHDEMLAALKRQQVNIRRWIETGIPADAAESQAISEQIDAAVAKAEGKR